MRTVLFLMLLSACEDARRVNVVAPQGVSIQVETSRATGAADVCVSVTTTQGVQIPVLVPMPLPYERVLTERPVP